MAVKQNPPWLFGLLGIPYGVQNAIVAILMPYLLRRQGVAVDHIAAIVALANIPSIWYFVYSPIVDLGLRRRTWFIFSAVLTALCSTASIFLVPVNLTALTITLIAGVAIGMVMSSANGALLNMLDATMHGRASGWYQAANVGAGAFGGGITLWLADRVSLPVLAICSGVVVLAPAAAAFLIVEPAPLRRVFGSVFHDLFRDFRQVLTSRRTWIGLIFLLSPVGSAAVQNLISSLGPDYKASPNEITLVTGIAGGVITAFGCFVGGLIADRMSRMKAYSLAGGLSALFALYLGFAGKTGFTYAAGYSGYAIAAGVAYAVFTALVLEVMGTRKHAVGTTYSLLVASGNLPIVYMTWLDGVGYKHWGVRGLMGVDALANGVGALLLLFVAASARRFWKQNSEPAH